MGAELGQGGVWGSSAVGSGVWHCSIRVFHGFKLSFFKREMYLELMAAGSPECCVSAGISVIQIVY
jgi:hypothetical protein